MDRRLHRSNRVLRIEAVNCAPEGLHSTDPRKDIHFEARIFAMESHPDLSWERSGRRDLHMEIARVRRPDAVCAKNGNTGEGTTHGYRSNCVVVNMRAAVGSTPHPHHPPVRHRIANVRFRDSVRGQSARGGDMTE